MATNLGSYYVSVVPSAQGISSALSGALAGPASAEGVAAGRALSGGISSGAAAGSKAASASLKGVGAVALGVAGTLATVKIGKSLIDAAEGARRSSEIQAAVLKASGGAANVTAAELKKLARAQSDLTGVSIGTIKSAETLMLTFRSVRNEAGAGNDIFNQSIKVAQDMSTVLGQDLQSSVTLLGKALGNPTIGLTALQRVGVIFTKQQKDQIQALAESGKTMEAQKLILDELKREYGGAGEAAATASDHARVQWGRLQFQLGQKLLPVVDLVAKASGAAAKTISLIPAPILSAGVAAGAGALAWRMSAKAIERNVLGVGSLIGMLRAYIPTAEGATVATGELAVAQGAAGKAAASSGMGGLIGRLGVSKLAFTGAAAAAVGASYALKGWLKSTRQAPADMDGMIKSLERFGSTGVMSGAGRDQGGIPKLIKDIKLFKRENSGLNKAANNTVGAIYRSLPGAGDDALTNLTKHIGQYDDALKQMVQSGRGKEAADAFGRIRQAMLAAGMSQGDVRHFFNDYIGAARDAGVSTDSLSFKIQDSKNQMVAWWAAQDRKTDRDGFIGSLNRMSQAAQDAKDKLDQVAAAGKNALGERLAVPEARDALSGAQNAFNEALKSAREGGYTGDFMNMADTSDTALDLRDKFRAVQSATADLGGAMANAGVPIGDVQLQLQAITNQFVNTGPIRGYKTAVDELSVSTMILVGAQQQQAQAQAQAIRLAQIDAFNKANPMAKLDKNGQLATPPGYSPAEWYSMWHGSGMGGGRASGGPVSAGTLYRVNELGTEFFRPSVSGEVIPMGRASGGTTQVNIYNPVGEPASTSIPRAARQLASLIGGR